MVSLIRVRVAAAFLLAVLVAVPVAAKGPSVPPRSRALLLLRVLVYDRNLARRTGPEVVVAVLHRSGSRPSQTESEALIAAFGEVSREVVAGGRPVRAVSLPFEGEDDLVLRLEQARASALYVCVELDGEVRAISRATRRARVLSAGGDRDLVGGGLSLALVSRGPRAAIVLSPAAARAEGADLDAALLALAEVVPERGAVSP